MKTSGNPMKAVAATVRYWQESANSVPPPSAKPFTKQKVGIFEVRNFAYASWPNLMMVLASSAFVSAVIPDRSAPAAKINGLPVIKFGRNQKNVIMIVHPFWDLRNIREANWLAETKAELDEYANSRNGLVSIIDTFNLHRRPGWCYEKLVSR